MALGYPRFCVLVLLLASSISLGKSDESNTNLLQGINSFRAVQNLPALTVNDNAQCIANRISKQLDRCTDDLLVFSALPRPVQQFPNYKDMLDKCKLQEVTVRDGVVLTSCVSQRNDTLVLESFTNSTFSSTLRSRKYVGIGLNSEDNKIAVVLTTNTSSGIFASEVGSGAVRVSGLWCLFGLFSGFVVLG